MISIFMRKIFAFLFLTIGVLACTPQDPPLEEEKNPEEEIPAPEPEPEPDPEPEPYPAFETSFEAIANMGVGWNLGNTLESVWTGDTDGRDGRRWHRGSNHILWSPRKGHRSFHNA